MTQEEELIQLREEKRLLREQTCLQKQQIEQQQERMGLLKKQKCLQQQQIAQLSKQVRALQEQLAKDSHNSHLPTSSDRFVRQPRSLRKKSGKPSSEQSGHEGHTLFLSETPDEVLRHPVEKCVHCQHDLQDVVSLRQERRLVIDLPPRRLLIQEHQAEQKWCPHCQQITSAAFPSHVRVSALFDRAFGRE